jgi:hypothetical protein
MIALHESWFEQNVFLVLLISYHKEIDGKIIEQMAEFIHIRNVTSETKKDTGMKLQRYNEINGIRKGILAHQCQLTQNYAYITSHQEQDLLTAVKSAH